MAINPAPMDQCASKCKCIAGVNANLAYDCNAPCEEGKVFIKEECDCYPTQICPGEISVALVANLSSRGGNRSETMFLTIPAGGVEGGGVRVNEAGMMQHYGGDDNSATSDLAWRDIGLAPFNVGDTYEGQQITNISYSMTMAGACGARPRHTWVAYEGEPGSYLGEIQFDSVTYPPRLVSGPTDAEDQESSPPHSFATYVAELTECDGSTTEVTFTATGQLGSPPPFPTFVRTVIANYCD